MKSLAIAAIASTAGATFAYAGTWPTASIAGMVVSSAPGDQSGVYAVSDGAGGVLTAWKDTRGGNPDVFAARVTLHADKPWTANGNPLANTVDHEHVRQLIDDGAGGVLVCWAVLSDLFIQRISTAGTPIWPAPVLAGSNYSAPCVSFDERNCGAILVSDGAHGAILVWRTNSSVLRSQRVDGAGNLLWTPGGVSVSSLPSAQSQPHAVADGAGGIIVAWEDWRGGSSDIFLQRLDSGGIAPWGPDGVAMTATAASESYPKVTTDGSGGAVVSWNDQGVSAFAQRVDPGGNKLWTPAGVYVGAYAYRTMIPDGTGGAIITLAPASIQPYFFAQRIAGDGTTPWGNPVELCHNAAGGVFDPEQCSDGAGGSIIAWSDTRNGNEDIFAQRVSASGTKVWGANGVAICTGSDGQEAPVPVPTPGGGAIIAFAGVRVLSERNIYAQHISAAGVLGDIASAVREPNPQIQLSTCNPCQNDLNIQFAMPVADGGKLRVLDAAGRLRAEMRLYGAQGVRSIGAEDWPAGVYLVVLEAHGATRSAKAVLVH